MFVFDYTNSDDWLNDLEYKALVQLKEHMATAFWNLPQYMIDAFNARTEKLKALNQKGAIMYHVFADGIAIQEAYTQELAEYYADAIKAKFADMLVEIKFV